MATRFIFALLALVPFVLLSAFLDASLWVHGLIIAVAVLVSVSIANRKPRPKT